MTDAEDRAHESYLSIGPGYPAGSFGDPKYEPTGVSCVSLRSLVEYDVQPWQSFLVKMDCEGGELTTLRDDLGVLAKADYIAIELHEYGATHKDIQEATAVIDNAIAHISRTHDCERDGVIFRAIRRDRKRNRDVANNLSLIPHRHQLFRFLDATGRGGQWAEIGVAEGGHSRMMLEQSQSAQVHMVDVWDGEHDYDSGKAAEWFEQCRQLQFDYPQRCTLIQQFSIVAAEWFARDYFDFVFIDADHTYAGVKADFAAWYPRLRSGGVMAGHDYVDSPSYGVIKAVDEFVEYHGLDMTLLPVDDHDNSVWAFVKP